MSLPPSLPSDSARIKLGGLVSKRQRWGLTLKGWALLAFTAISLFALAVFRVHPFLAINKPVPSDTLVIEGWVSEVGIKYAAEAISSTNYQNIFITGGPISGFGGYTSDFNTYAHYGFSRLLKKGIPPERMTRLPCRVLDRDRTYSSAVVLRDYLRTNDLQLASVNVVTDAVHARRSRLLFQKALGPETQVGIIAIPPTDYRAERWWRYSAGVKDVFSEAFAYVYARFLF